MVGFYPCPPTVLFFIMFWYFWKMNFLWFYGNYTLIKTLELYYSSYFFFWLMFFCIHYWQVEPAFCDLLVYLWCILLRIYKMFSTFANMMLHLSCIHLGYMLTYDSVIFRAAFILLLPALQYQCFTTRLPAKLPFGRDVCRGFPREEALFRGSSRLRITDLYTADSKV